MKKYLIIILFSLPLPVLSQEINIPERISEIAEEIAAEENDPFVAELFSDMLYDLSQDPVRINTGNENEISRLFFLSDFQVKAIADYIRNSGSILSPFEIANIPGFDRESAEMMIPFITFAGRPVASHDTSRLSQSIQANFTYKSGTTDTSFLGSNWRILTRYKLSYRSVYMGFTTEKDPGENYFDRNTHCPDFISGYISYTGKGLLKQVVLGDFSARFGQGTNINTQMRTGLSLSSTGYLSGRNEIRPYTSTDENNFFRGIAAELTYKNIDLHLFVSRHRIDATENPVSDSSVKTIRSLYASGLHNTSFYLLKKDILTEGDLAVHCSANFSNLRIGAVISGTWFSSRIKPDVTQPANMYDFSGYENFTGTFYYNGTVRKSVFFGELSLTGSKGYAVVQGLSFRPAGRLNINVLYRDYSPGFISFRGKGPSRGSSNSNEYGILGNMTLEAARYLFITAGADFSCSPWLKYRCSSPSSSNKYETRIRYLPSKKISLEGLCSSRSSVTDDSQENQIPGQVETITRSSRVSVKYSPGDYITFATQAGYTSVSPTGNKGLMLLQDVSMKIRHIPVSIWMRYAIFSTSGFESGIYSWENDLMNSFSIPVLYGTGSRSYIMISWKMFHRAELRFKYGITSSAVINGTKNTDEFRIQIKLIL